MSHTLCQMYDCTYTDQDLNAFRNLIGHNLRNKSRSMPRVQEHEYGFIVFIMGGLESRVSKNVCIRLRGFGFTDEVLDVYIRATLQNHILINFDNR